MWAWRRWSQPRPPRCRPTRLGATSGGPIGRAAATAPILLEAPAGVRSRTWGVNGDIPIAPRTRRRPTIGGGNANRGAPQRAKSATVLRDRPRSPRPLRRPRWRPRRRQSHRRRPRLHPPRVCRRPHSRHRSSASSGCRSRSSGRRAGPADPEALPTQPLHRPPPNCRRQGIGREPYPTRSRCSCFARMSASCSSTQSPGSRASTISRSRRARSSRSSGSIVSAR